MQKNCTIFKMKGVQNRLPTHCTKVITSRNRMRSYEIIPNYIVYKLCYNVEV